MVNQTIGEAFGGGMRGVANAANTNARTQQTYMRTGQMPAQLKLRQMQAMGNLAMRKQQMMMQQQAQRISMMRMQMAMRQMQMRAQMDNNRIAAEYGFAPTPVNFGAGGMEMPAQNDQGPSLENLDPSMVLNQVTGQGNGNGNGPVQGGGNPPRTNGARGQIFLPIKTQESMLNRGDPYRMQAASLPEGQQGTYRKLREVDASKLENMTRSMTQLAHSMDLIEQGAKYYGNLPGGMSKYISAMTGYLTGNPSEKDKEIITKAGISQVAMTQAVENIMNIMALAKTNETLHQVMTMILPQKGDTEATYKAKQQAVFNELKMRTAQAKFALTMGEPIDPTADKDSKNYINAFMNSNQYNSVYEKGLTGTDIPFLYAPLPGQITFPSPSMHQNQPLQTLPQNEDVPDAGIGNTEAMTQNDKDAVNQLMAENPGLTLQQAQAILKKYKATKK